MDVRVDVDAGLLRERLAAVEDRRRFAEVRVQEQRERARPVDTVPATTSPRGRPASRPRCPACSSPARRRRPAAPAESPRPSARLAEERVRRIGRYRDLRLDPSPARRRSRAAARPPDRRCRRGAGSSTCRRRTAARGRHARPRSPPARSAAPEQLPPATKRASRSFMALPPDRAAARRRCAASSRRTTGRDRRTSRRRSSRPLTFWSRATWVSTDARWARFGSVKTAGTFRLRIVSDSLRTCSTLGSCAGFGTTNPATVIPYASARYPNASWVVINCRRFGGIWRAATARTRPARRARAGTRVALAW